MERDQAQGLCLATFDVRCDDIAVRRADPGEALPSDTLSIRLDASAPRSIAAGETLIEDALSAGRLGVAQLLSEDHRLSALVEELLTHTVVPVITRQEIAPVSAYKYAAIAKNTALLRNSVSPSMPAARAAPSSAERTPGHPTGS
ncbi:hypothetical protein AB0471_30310 [Streptomyces sp. NPDC052002]|uniref:hypothetical protein n=1 Tax=Streptomyces sp. NPDC052002 TaxID=3155754 RepID=UPI00344CA2D5